MSKTSIVLMSMLFLGSCVQEISNESLPILADSWIDEHGNEVAYRPPSFKLTDQNNNTFTNKQLEGKIHVVDFFFSACPTICPKMTSHLKIVHNYFLTEQRVQFVSFSIDSKYDTPEKLNTYARSKGIHYDRWKLLSDESGETVMNLSREYKVRAFEEMFGEDRNLYHDGTFILLDDLGRVRGYYDGLAAETPTKLVIDIKKLLKQN